MIPAEIAELVDVPGQAISFGSTDQQLQPRVGRAIAVKTSGDKSSISFLVPKQMFIPHKDNIDQNKQISLTVTYPLTHRSFQFKGDCAGYSGGSAQDIDVSKSNMQAFHQILTQWYGPEAAQHYFKYETSDLVHVNLKVREVYDQTPGPGAGKKVYPN